MRRIGLRTVISFFIISLFFLLQSAYAVKVDQIVVFGDSLSDNGNIFSLTTKAHKIFSSIPVIPKDPPYYKGRFSNGPVWIDDLAATMNVPLVNYAYGGAWAEPLHDSRLVVPFGIGMQVSYYLVSAATDFHKGNHLYIIWAGANDYVAGRDDVDYATTNTVSSIETQIDWLIYYGAKNILVMNLPKLSVVPEVVGKGADAVQMVEKLVNMHNIKLEKMVAAEQKKNPDLKIIYGDITPYFNDTVEHPEKYGIKDTKTPCYTGDYSLKNLIDQREISAAKEQNLDIMNTPSFRVAYATAKLVESGVEACDIPDEHLFWDQIHPTRVLHNLMSLDAMTMLTKNDIQGASISS